MSDPKPSPALAILAELRGEAPRPPPPPPPPVFARDAARAIEPPPREGEARELAPSSSSSSSVALALWKEAEGHWCALAELLVPAVLGASSGDAGVELAPEVAAFERHRQALLALGARAGDAWSDADAAGRARLSAVSALVRMAAHLRAVSLSIPEAAHAAAVAR